MAETLFSCLAAVTCLEVHLYINAAVPADRKNIPFSVFAVAAFCLMVAYSLEKDRAATPGKLPFSRVERVIFKKVLALFFAHIMAWAVYCFFLGPATHRQPHHFIRCMLALTVWGGSGKSLTLLESITWFSRPNHSTLLPGYPVADVDTEL